MSSRLLAVVLVVALAGCAAPEASAPEVVEVTLNSTTPVLDVGPVAIWVFLPESVRECPAGVAVGMLAFGGAEDGFWPLSRNESDVRALAAATFLLTRFPGEGPESSAQFFPPNGTGSVAVYIEQGRVADPVIYTVGNATWHERTVGGWERMPSAAATLRAPCAVEVE